jgi:hypothetical protein
MVITVVMRKNQPGSITAEPAGPLIASSPTASPQDWKAASTTVR